MDETQSPQDPASLRPVSPTVRRHMLAAELKSLRHTAGLTHVDVAARLGWPQAKVSKIEGSRQNIGVDAVIALADICRASAEHRDHLVELAHDARARGWWESYQDVLPPDRRLQVGFEAEARAVRTFAAEAVPDLVQTPEYAEAVLVARRRSGAARESARLLEVLARRQQNLAAAGAELDFVLAESALRREVGGPEVLRGQWERLLAVAERPEVALRVLPFSAGAVAVEGPFTILSFGAASPPAVVCLPGLVATSLVEAPESVNVHQEVFEDLAASALNPEDSLRWLEREGEVVLG